MDDREKNQVPHPRGRDTASGKKVRPAIAQGYRVGHLEVVSRTDRSRGGYALWRCRCDCGGEILLDTRYLQRGTVTDCGCITKVKPGQRDLTGQRFGRLVCLEPTLERTTDGGVMWHCRCDCGAECLAAARQLVTGNKKSCGCLGSPPLKEFVGKRFGRLTVTAYAGKRSGMHRWKCSCDCGGETTVGQTLLQSGKTRSCGCIQKDAYKDNLKLIDGTSVAILEAGRNRRIASNTSGYTGVYQNRKSGKWVAQITFKGKTYYLGSHEKLEDAVKARRRGEEIHEDFLSWYYQNHTVPEKRE